jgi:glycosyltransferase involved in cell wall biosynthesis
MPSIVTIVIPTYDRAHVVMRAIDSVLGQTFKDVSALVVDDGSTDDTALVLARYRDNPRVRVVHHANNQGVTAAKNTGLASIEPGTAFVGILDSDDVLTPTAVENLLRVFDSTGHEFSQVFGWCEDMHSQSPTGQMDRQTGIVAYDDALSGRFAGEFWQLVRWDLLQGRRFEPRAAGGEAAVWWPLLRSHPGWLVHDVVRQYDRAGMDRVSIPRYTRREAAKRMWAYQAGLRPIAKDLRARYPQRYAALLSELAKWAALAGEGRRARAASRTALRAYPNVQALRAILIAHMPARLLRSLLAVRLARRTGLATQPGRTSPSPDVRIEASKASASSGK